MAQELYELPVGWEWKTLNELTKVQSGTGFPKKYQGYIGEQFPFLKVSDMNLPGNESKITSWNNSISDKTASEIRAKVLPAGAVIFPKIGAAIGTNKKRILTTPCAFDNNVMGLEARGGLTPDYLYWYLQGFDLSEWASTASLPSMKASTVKEHKIPLPPLNEQKRIVAKLDALLSRIDTTITHLHQTLELSKALFESASAHVFNNGDEWDTVKLSVLLERGWITSHLDGNHGSNYPRKAEFVDEGVPYISANCLRNGEVIMSLSKFLTPQRASMLRKGIAMNNDVLFAHNATVGPVAILQTDCEKVVLSTSLTYYRCDPKFIFPEYLAQYMKAAPFTSQYRAVMSQSTRNQVPITKQREFKFIVPPLNEQSRIAAQLDELSKRTKTLEVTSQEKINDLAALKASLLDAAFKGEL